MQTSIEDTIGMLSATAIGTIMYASMLVLLCIGFSFTHMMEKFPNFAHISYANIGTLFAYTLVRLMGWNPYASWPVAALFNGFTAVGIYLLIVRPMRKRGPTASTSPSRCSPSCICSGPSCWSSPSGL